ncbi:MAG TPA: VOC family protein [Flavisolibacter sp.]|jgi:predicted lactoylglutathione lyase|nr:VOC family protein [Flavisolibacter sp.]
MAKDLWINLPVKNLARSKEFFTKLGFTFGDGPGNTPTSAPLMISSKTVVMLFEEPVFKSFVKQEITDTSKSCEVLFSFDAASKDEVDQLAKKVVEAGGKTNHTPYAMEGNMYGCLFTDPDGHKWNILHMK